jgi:molybdopterin molybdotransferase
MLSVDNVLGLVAQKVHPLAAVTMGLAEAHRAILAEDVRMAEESPPFDRAQLDGFAVRSADFAGGLPQGLRLAGQIDAGSCGTAEPLKAYECIAINTGAMVPPGADAVLMVEHSERRTDASGAVLVRATRTVGAGYGVQRRGADATAGQVVLEAGRRLGPVELAVCAAAGAARVRVRRVRGCVLATGDELVDVGTRPAPGQIRNSNGPMLRALLQEATGLAPLDLGTCGDDAERLRGLLRRGLEEADLLVVSGGMSMGTKDLVPPLLKELGVEFHVEKVRIKPGKPLVIGGRRRADGGMSYVAGLPGNPVSSFVTFHRFVMEMIARMEGRERGAEIVEAVATAPLPANGDREFYGPCVLQRRGLGLEAEVLAWKGSADLFTLVKANGLVIRPAGDAEVPLGGMVRVLRV